MLALVRVLVPLHTSLDRMDGSSADNLSDGGGHSPNRALA